jgi:hypothetical protein
MEKIIIFVAILGKGHSVPPRIEFRPWCSSWASDLAHCQRFGSNPGVLLVFLDCGRYIFSPPQSLKYSHIKFKLEMSSIKKIPPDFCNKYRLQAVHSASLARWLAEPPSCKKSTYALPPPGHLLWPLVCQPYPLSQSWGSHPLFRSTQCCWPFRLSKALASPRWQTNWRQWFRPWWSVAGYCQKT